MCCDFVVVVLTPWNPSCSSLPHRILRWRRWPSLPLLAVWRSITPSQTPERSAQLASLLMSVCACVGVCVLLSQWPHFIRYPLSLLLHLSVTEDLTGKIWLWPNYSFDPLSFDCANINIAGLCWFYRRPLEMPPNLLLPLPRTHNRPSWSPQKSRQHTHSNKLRYDTETMFIYIDVHHVVLFCPLTFL